MRRIPTTVCLLSLLVSTAEVRADPVRRNPRASSYNSYGGQGHSIDVLSLAISGDGKFAVTVTDASGFLRITLWALDVGRPLYEIQPGKRPASWPRVEFSPDGGQFAACVPGPNGEAGMVKIYHRESAEEALALRADSKGVNALSYSPDGRRLLTGGAGGAVKVWEVKSGKLLCDVGSHEDAVLSVGFSGDGKRGFSVAQGAGKDTGDGARTIEGEVKVWDLTRGQLLHVLNGKELGMSSVAFSPSGRYIVTGNDTVWEVCTGKIVQNLRDDNEATRNHRSGAVRFLPNTGNIISSSDRILIWSAATGKVVKPGPAHQNLAFATTFSR